MMPITRLLFLIPSKSYRAPRLMEAVSRMQKSTDFEAVIGSETPQALAALFPDKFLLLDFADLHASVEKIMAYDTRHALDMVIAFDEEVISLANLANSRLTKSKDVLSVILTMKNKVLTRIALSGSPVAQPEYSYLFASSDGGKTTIRSVSGGTPIDTKILSHDLAATESGQDPKVLEQTLKDLLLKAADAARAIGFPVVVKAVGLSGSRGIMRANNESELEKGILESIAIAGKENCEIRLQVLIERYIPGAEVAVDGFVKNSELIPLAVFDKPDPLIGPYFEETIYTTPSRYETKTIEDIINTVQMSCNYLGVTQGPIHAELRLPRQYSDNLNNFVADQNIDTRLHLLEIAARPIGGQCGDILGFLGEKSFYEVLIDLYLKDDFQPQLAEGAFGAMMIPIEKTGTLKEVSGIEKARAVRHIERVSITIPPGQEVIRLPEGESYLGFILSRADTPEQAELALRQAHAELKILIDDAEAKTAILDKLTSNGGGYEISTYIKTLLSYIKDKKCAS